ncbi:MAG: hypothetical protein AAF517_12245 [Planctomycetota bacterium]
MELPVFRKEMMRIARSRSSFTFVVLTSVVSMFAALSLWPSASDIVSGSEMHRIFQVLFTLQGCLLCLFLPHVAVESILVERRQNTLEMLWVSGLSPSSIVFSKILAVASFAGLLILASSPFVCSLYILGGVELRSIFEAYAVIGAMCALSIACALVISALSGSGRISSLWPSSVMLCWIIFGDSLTSWGPGQTLESVFDGMGTGRLPYEFLGVSGGLFLFACLMVLLTSRPQSYSGGAITEETASYPTDSYVPPVRGVTIDDPNETAGAESEPQEWALHVLAGTRARAFRFCNPDLNPTKNPRSNPVFVKDAHSSAGLRYGLTFVGFVIFLLGSAGRETTVAGLGFLLGFAVLVVYIPIVICRSVLREREQKTIEELLTTSQSRNALVMGKFYLGLLLTRDVVLGAVVAIFVQNDASGFRGPAIAFLLAGVPVLVSICVWSATRTKTLGGALFCAYTTLVVCPGVILITIMPFLAVAMEETMGFPIYVVLIPATILLTTTFLSVAQHGFDEVNQELPVVQNSVWSDDALGALDKTKRAAR